MTPEEMRLRYYGDPVLRQKARDVEVFDDRLEQQARKMYEIMYAHDGLGLAANQVGFLSRLIVLDVPLDDEHRAVMALANPVILGKNGRSTAEEGCLSIPEIRADVARYSRLEVEACNLRGEKVSFEAEGLLARAIQHEIDHLDGVLFVDRLSAVKRRLLDGRLRQITQEHPAG